ncbi:MAG: hypothetical protein ACRD1G_15615, partial [Acidimicrobiales bacterium]
MSAPRSDATLHTEVLVAATATREAAEALFVALSKTLSIGERSILQVRDRGVVSMVSGVPDHPAARAVATLAIANSAASLALHLVVNESESKARA